MAQSSGRYAGLWGTQPAQNLVYAYIPIILEYIKSQDYQLSSLEAMASVANVETVTADGECTNGVHPMSIIHQTPNGGRTAATRAGGQRPLEKQ
jgi:hypothetical protein